MESTYQSTQHPLAPNRTRHNERVSNAFSRPRPHNRHVHIHASIDCPPPCHPACYTAHTQTGRSRSSKDTPSRKFLVPEYTSECGLFLNPPPHTGCGRIESRSNDSLSPSVGFILPCSRRQRARQETVPHAPPSFPGSRKTSPPWLYNGGTVRPTYIHVVSSSHARSPLP